APALHPAPTLVSGTHPTRPPVLRPATGSRPARPPLPTARPPDSVPAPCPVFGVRVTAAPATGTRPARPPPATAYIWPPGASVSKPLLPLWYSTTATSMCCSIMLLLHV